METERLQKIEAALAAVEAGNDLGGWMEENASDGSLKTATHVTDESVVRELVEEIKGLQRFLDFYKLRYNVFVSWQKNLPEPYRAECCNILANGKA